MPQPATLPAATDSDTEPHLFVLYGTESGNSKIIALDAVKTLARAGLRARALGLDELAASELTKVGHAIFMVSTSGDGDMPYNAVDFWEALGADDFPRLERLRYGMVALGESVYEEFCAAGIAMDERLSELGATRLVDRVDCDYDFEVHAATWLEQALDIFAASIETDASAGAGAAAIIISASAEEGRPRHDGRIANKRVLTREDSDREVVHYSIALDAVEADAAPFDWQPGDSLNLFYGNDPALVRDIMARLKLAPDTVPNGAEWSIEHLLTHHFELRAISRDLVKAAAAQEEGSELGQMLVNSSHAEFEDWRDAHDLFQLLLDHPAISFEAEHLISLLRPLQPRAYSIASSPLLGATLIDLSVRTIRYRQGTRDHHGVVSGGLSQRALTGDRLDVQHVATPSFHLPDDPAADIVMVGAGVGVAPFRAFLQHRAARGDTGRNWLFHGIRNPDEDELYAREFAAWRDDGLLFSYDICASRLPGGGRYVQDGMKERGRELFSYLDAGGLLYVCGDARRMAKDVRTALRDIAADALGSASQGEFFVEGLQAGRRYRQDVY